MKNIMIIITAIFIAIGFSGCGEKVEPAQYGKVLSMSGYSPEILPPGRYYLFPTETLVILDGSSHMEGIALGVTIRDSNVDGSYRTGLDMQFELSLRYKLKNDKEILNAMFSDFHVTNNFVSAPQIFLTYGKNPALNKVREILSNYTPEEALSNREVINNKIAIEMKELFKDKPIDVYDVIVSKMSLPKIIQTRIETAKDAELKLNQAQAEQRIALDKRDNEIILAQKEAEKRLIDAQAAAAENKALNEGVNSNILQLRSLEIQRIYAEAWLECMKSEGKCGSNTVYMPFEAVQTTGANIRMFQK